jgi:hypothetical protein
MKISKEKKNLILNDKDHLSVHQISKKYALPLIEIKNILKASEKKTPKWYYALLVSNPVVLLILLEILLRIMNYGYNFDQWLDAGEGKYIINPNLGKKSFTGEDFNPTTSEDYFDIQKKANSFRIFASGGSSTEWFPYNPMGSFSRYSFL